MNAEVVTNSGGNRVKLGEVLPLDTPLSVHIFPSYVCNFRCSYCLHSLSDDELNNMSFKRELMDYNVLVSAVDQIKFFPKKLKSLIFAGHGEPLIHKRIADMVYYAKKRDVAEKIEIVTNGYLLNKNMCDDLISAGLDRLRVSIQGVSEESYKKVTNQSINLKDLIEKLTYFFEHKTNTEVYVKIIDMALSSKEEEQVFYQMFGDVCDKIAIEYVIPFANGVDYSNIKTDYERCKQGHKSMHTKICAMPFYMIVIEPDGSILPCCSTQFPLKLGNVKDNSIKDIWNGQKMRDFQVVQLQGKSGLYSACKKCVVPSHGMQQGDYLDDYADQLVARYK